MKKRDWLAELRKQSEMTQNEVAAACNIKRTTYANYELGNRTPKNGDIARKVTASLGAPDKWILFFM